MFDGNAELKDHFKTVLKHKWLIFFGTILCVAISVIITQLMTPVYEASLQMLVSQKQVIVAGNEQSAGETYQAILSSERSARTFSQMLQNRSTAELVIEKLNIPILPIELTEKIKAEPVRDTQLIEVTVQDEDPAQAQRIANAMGDVFKKIVTDIDLNSRGSSKSQPLISIDIVEPAVEPLEPVKPRPLLNVILAFIIGLALSTTLAMVLSRLDKTIKEVEEIERMSGMISLGQIPLIPKGSTELVVKTEPRSLAAEAFRMLRTNLQYVNFESTIKTIIITSAGVGEGKTLFSANLAAVLARAGNKVLLIGCDLRRPRLYEIFELTSTIGLSNILIGTTRPEEALQETCVDGLDIIASGPTPPNPVELLESRRMRLILENAREYYDFIILDCPPITSITDALVLVPNSDGVIVLARYGLTNKPAFKNALGALEKVGARVLGFALNGISKNNAYGYYGGGYHYASDEALVRPKKRWKVAISIAALIGTTYFVDLFMHLGMAKFVFSIL